MGIDLYDNPFYMYALVLNPENRKLDTEPGIMTPQYMYTHDKNYLLDPILDSWRRVIVNTWGMYPQDPATLTRREIIDALNIRLGGKFMDTINFFRFVPSPTLGWQLKLLLGRVNIYRIDLNNTALYNYIRKEDIDWGKDKRVFSRKLNRLYWQNVGYEEYIKFYRDNISVFDRERLLDQFNQITITVKDGFIPKKVCEDMTTKLGLYNPTIGGKI